MTTMFFEHTSEPVPEGAFFGHINELMRLISIIRLFAWLWHWLRILLNREREEDTSRQRVAPSLSRNEFGHINMNGAF